MMPIISMRREVIEMEPTAGKIQQIKLGEIKAYLYGIRIPTRLALWLLHQFFDLEVA